MQAPDAPSSRRAETAPFRFPKYVGSLDLLMLGPKKADATDRISDAAEAEG
jgi:hypothetical protein